MGGADKYNLLEKNCCHFSMELYNRLCRPGNHIIATATELTGAERERGNVSVLPSNQGEPAGFPACLLRLAKAGRFLLPRSVTTSLNYKMTNHADEDTDDGSDSNGSDEDSANVITNPANEGADDGSDPNGSHEDSANFMTKCMKCCWLIK